METLQKLFVIACALILKYMTTYAKNVSIVDLEPIS